ncbi:MAG TPA: VOC family protein [Ramlibacter sp.]
MARKIFVNLPIKNMERSQAFFRSLGFDFNPQFSNEQGACMVISEENFVMLLVEPFFQGFLRGKSIADSRSTCEVLVALSCETRAEVDEMVDKAIAGGATETREPQDHGFMYARAFDDLDGHTWEPVWMDASAVPPQA